MTKDAQCALTILTCRGEDLMATKLFYAQEDGTINKESFSAGKFFKHEEKQVSNIYELAEVFDNLLNEPKKFVIRGKAKKAAGEIVRRKTHAPHAAFDAVPRRWVMLDIDKQECPAYFDPAKNPEEVARWALGLLPEPFRNVTCFCKFSASQSVPGKIGDAPQSRVSMHIVFWCDRAASEEEWKRYFKGNPAPIDRALFSPVQIHYTARPIFQGIDDPVPRRTCVLKGDNDVLTVPPIPAPETRKSGQRRETAPEVSEDSRDKALDLLRPYYKEGARSRLSGAIAATLYRGGWGAEDVADFVQALAASADDEEAAARYDSALRICSAVDDNRPAQGKPVLLNEFGIDNLDEIMTVLGVGQQDINGIISKLTKSSTPEEITNILKLLVPLTIAEQEMFLDKIKKMADHPKASLNRIFKSVKNEMLSKTAFDPGDMAMDCMLKDDFESGQLLLRATDGNFWQYNGKYWEVATEDFLRNKLLPHARTATDIDEYATVSGVLNAAINILKGKVFRLNDAARLLNGEAPAVINCQNGELWFDKDGGTVLKPHRADSYLRHCLKVPYDPAATCPMFDEAVLGIFAESEDPQGMVRHFMELAGYICQPWRKIALIVLLHGEGSNGKTSLINIVRNIIGEKAIMSDRISKLEDNPFKIGGLNGKLMFLDDDVDEGICLSDGLLKKISEEKVLTGQHKFKPLFEFTCRAVPVMLTNSYPSIKDLSHGMQRRMMVIPFKRIFKITKDNRGLFDDIWEREASGILNRIVEGYQRLRVRGGFDDPKDCLDAKRDWLVHSNIFNTFIEESCKKGTDFKQPLKELYDTFKLYCGEAGVKHVPGRLGIEKRLRSLGYEVTSYSNGHKIVHGIRTKEIERLPSFKCGPKM